MPLLRWLLGSWRTLFGMWDPSELAYYAATGLDPKTPAFQRWDVRLKTDVKAAQTEAERVLPLHNYIVILDDKLGFTPEDVIFFTQNAGQAQAVHEEFERELRSRSSGDFWHRMIRHRQLDYFHVAPPIEEMPAEAELDEDAFREMFKREHNE